MRRVYHHYLNCNNRLCNYEVDVIITLLYVHQGSILAVTRLPNASENSGGWVKTLPSVVRRASHSK